jgi:CheY-like chemotaxis protein
MSSRIVLIEDNPADVLLVKKALEANGVAYELTQFSNGLDALKVLCAPDGFVPDAILLDLNTPKSDGFHVLGRLKNTPHLADVPVAIITSSQAGSDKARSNALGAFHTSRSHRAWKSFSARSARRSNRCWLPERHWRTRPESMLRDWM